MKKFLFYSPGSTAFGNLSEDLRKLSNRLSSIGDVSEEFTVWGMQWAKLIGESLHAELVWIAMLDENKNVNWLASWPDGGVSAPMPREGDNFFPLVHNNALLGWLFLIPSKRLIDEGFVEKVSGLTALIALALFQENERLILMRSLHRDNEGFKKGYNAMFEGLARILGLRDHETEEHTFRVTRLMMKLVEHIKIPPQEWEAIRRGCLLHDIGKLGVPDTILLKPGSLTDAERRMMQLHVVYGFNILTPITNIKQTLDIVLYHHERWDGKGYPGGLKGGQIPLVARLFAIVDVFDALTSDRPYRTAWSESQALAHIKEQSGAHFDPEMVAAFVEIMKLPD